MIRYGIAALAALLITGLIMVAAAQLVRERPQRHDISMPTTVSLVTVPRDEEAPEETEEKPPEPPRKEPQLDFAPELPTPSLTAPALTGPAVDLDPALFRGTAPAGPMIFEAAELDRAPRAVVRRQPQYPYRARQRRVEGRVKVRFLVQTDGSVSQITILESEPAGTFDQAVIDAVSGWRFEAGRLAGEPVAAWIVTPILFDLDGGR